MSSLFSPGLQASTRVRIRRRRELPLKGDILVQVGDRVHGEQVIARAQLEGELRIVRAAEGLGIIPSELPGLLRVKAQQQVEQGEILAEMRGLWGLFRSTVVSPMAGTVEFVSPSTGHIGVRGAPKVLNLSAYIDGVVALIDDGRAVVIEHEATFVQGIFGVGGERIGTLKLLDVSQDSALTEAHIPSEARGQVLVGGHSPSPAALKKAARAGAVGFVTGSVSGDALHEYLGYDIGIAMTGDEDVPMTVIVTEGFGSISMGERAFAALSAVNGETVSINGATQVRAGALRPEIISRASSAPGARKDHEKGLEIGAQVRCIRVPYFGELGHIVALPHQPALIGTGAKARVLIVKLADGATITVPRANVEILG
jgi:hypothetical protein